MRPASPTRSANSHADHWRGDPWLPPRTTSWPLTGAGLSPVGAGEVYGTADRHALMGAIPQGRHSWVASQDVVQRRLAVRTDTAVVLLPRPGPPVTKGWMDAPSAAPELQRSELETSAAIGRLAGRAPQVYAATGSRSRTHATERRRPESRARRANSTANEPPTSPGPMTLTGSPAVGDATIRRP